MKDNNYWVALRSVNDDSKSLIIAYPLTLACAIISNLLNPFRKFIEFNLVALQFIDLLPALEGVDMLLVDPFVKFLYHWSGLRMQVVEGDVAPVVSGEFLRI
jgi:hypothetical protein